MGILPRLDDWRGLVEAQATRALGQTVQIGRLHARSSRWVPALELDEVSPPAASPPSSAGAPSTSSPATCQWPAASRRTSSRAPSTSNCCSRNCPASSAGTDSEPMLAGLARSRRPGDWRQWQGSLYAELPLADAARLRRHVDLLVDL